MILNLTTTFAYDAFRIIEALKNERNYYNIKSNSYITSYKVSDILETLEKMKLIILENELIESTKVLDSLLENHRDKIDTIEEQRLFIEEYIVNVRPAWVFIIPSGRDELKAYLDIDEYSVFKEADLYSDYSIDTINWWDSISAKIREMSEERQIEIGRSGEYLTLKYEKKRTGVNPLHKAIDSNRLGYDIVSIVERNEPTNLYIEVKTTTNNGGYIYITRNEWMVANSTSNYLFYVWNCSKSVNKIMILDIEKVKKHIPVEYGFGKWTEVKIDVNSLVKEYGWKEEFIDD